MSCSFGEKFRITVFGQSHSEAIGVVIDGIPAGIKLDMEKIGKFMSRRAPGNNTYSTKRKEDDIPSIISGVVDGITCGAPLCAVIKNNDQHSKDYSKIRNLPRPSHSDFAAHIKHNGFNDIRGGGNFSGRMTAPMCFAGAVAIQILEEKGIRIGAHIEKIAGVEQIFFIEDKSSLNEKFASQIIDGAELYIPLGDLVDLSQEVERLTKELNSIEAEIARASSKLSNNGFLEKAPKALVDAERVKLDKFIEMRKKLKKEISDLQ